MGEVAVVSRMCIEGAVVSPWITFAREQPRFAAGLAFT
jgi:hypothetical protein